MADKETDQNQDNPLKKQTDIPTKNQTVRVSLKAPLIRPSASAPASDQATAPQATAPQATASDRIPTGQTGEIEQLKAPVPMKKTASISVRKETVRVSQKAYAQDPSQTSTPPVPSTKGDQNEKMALWDKAINHTLRVSLKAPPQSIGAVPSPSSIDDLPAMGTENEKMALWDKAINHTLSVSLKAIPQTPSRPVQSSPQPTTPTQTYPSSNSNPPSHFAGYASPVLVNATEYLRQIRERIGEVVVGQDLLIERCIISLLTSGHLLLEGQPGLAKTLLVEAISKACHLDFGRIQFTSALLSSDFLGSEILGRKSGELIADQGPIFTNLLLAEGINQASSQVQGPLLEAMQERKVTFGSESFPLPTPFLVIATRPPVMQSESCELPAALLDRFMLCHRLQYPKPAEEDEILRRHLALELEKRGSNAVTRSEFDLVRDEAIGNPQDLVAAMEATRQIHVSEAMRKHAIRIVEGTRRHPDLQVGCSPRAGISLLKASRARALIHGRDQVILKDLFTLAEDACIHRISLSSEALAEGKTPQAVVQQILTASTF